MCKYIKFDMRNIKKHIFESLENEILKDENLEMISGGKFDNKFLASSLSALSLIVSTEIVNNTETQAINL